VMSWLLVSIPPERDLVAVETVGLALAAVAHLGVGRRTDPVFGHAVFNMCSVVVPFNVLGQELAKEFGGRFQAAPPGVEGLHLLEFLAGHQEQPIGIGHNGAEEGLALRRIVPVDQGRASRNHLIPSSESSHRLPPAVCSGIGTCFAPKSFSITISALLSFACPGGVRLCSTQNASVRGQNR
jgi:hypothetical protein